MSCKAVFPPLFMIAMMVFLIWFCSTLVENVNYEAEVANQHGELIEAYEEQRDFKLNSNYEEILQKIETERSQANPDSAQLAEIRSKWAEINKIDKDITDAQKAVEQFEKRHGIAIEHRLNLQFDENNKIVNLAKPHDVSYRETNNIVMGIAMGAGALTVVQGICQQNDRRKTLIVFGVLMMCVAGIFLGYNLGNPDDLQASKILLLAAYSIFGCAIFAQVIVIGLIYDAKDTDASTGIDNAIQGQETVAKDTDTTTGIDNAIQGQETVVAPEEPIIEPQEIKVPTQDNVVHVPVEPTMSPLPTSNTMASPSESVIRLKSASSIRLIPDQVEVLSSQQTERTALSAGSWETNPHADHNAEYNYVGGLHRRLCNMMAGKDMTN